MKTVVVGMSGGVDSSVAAALLKEQGYRVIGLFMNNWQEDDEDGCCTAASDWADVRKVCNQLDIPYYSVNFSQEYMDRVFSYFLEEYNLARTPNPDVLCNREIKFGPFLDYALSLGADYIATGHYCEVSHKDGKYYLLKAKDVRKDQTYFLNQLSQKQLEKVIFPLGNLQKSEVRALAKKYNLKTADKKDSTGICFIGERKFRDFLKNYITAKKGDIVDMAGNVVGKHEGVMFYTLGQRKGLNIGGVSGTSGGRWFVVDKNIESNTLIVSQGNEKPLYSQGLVAYNINWIPNAPEKRKFECYAKFRHTQIEQKVNVNITKDKIIVNFSTPQRAITPGQFVVFYDDEKCLGGGVIEEVIK